MFGASVLLALAIAAQDVLANPIRVRTSYAVKETHRAPQNWVKTIRAPAEKMLNMQIGLKQGNFGALETHLNEGMPSSQLNRESCVIDDLPLVSDPDHARYGQVKPLDSSFYSPKLSFL